MKRGVMVLMLSILAGCAHGLIAPLPDVPADQAVTVTVIREPQFVGSATTFLITNNGDEIVGLRQGEHIVLTLPAGDRTMGVTCFSCPHDSIFLRLEANGQYYIRVWATAGGPRIAQLARDPAEQIIKDTERLELGK